MQHAISFLFCSHECEDMHHAEVTCFLHSAMHQGNTCNCKTCNFIIVLQPWERGQDKPCKGDMFLRLARTVYMHHIWPYIWWLSCQKYRIYTVYIWFWPTLHVFCTQLSIKATHAPYFSTNQGCPVQFFGSKGSMKFVKVLEPSNCSSSSMCNFGNGGFCWFPWSYSSKTCFVLFYLCIIYYNSWVYLKSERFTAI